MPPPFGGDWLALILTVGATISILGTNSNTMMMGPRFLFALARDGYGPKILARMHPRFHTPAASILCQGLIALALALSGSFVQLALLSMTTRLFAYIGTAAGAGTGQALRRPPGRVEAARRPADSGAGLLLSVGLLPAPAGRTCWRWAWRCRSARCDLPVPAQAEHLASFRPARACTLRPTACTRL
jgi:hypothetical protein